MEVECVLTTNCEHWRRRNEKICKYTRLQSPGSSVRLQVEDLGMQWPRYDTLKSPDNRNMNLEHTCVDDVWRVMISCSKDEFWTHVAQRHQFGEVKVARAHQGCAHHETK